MKKIIALAVLLNVFTFTFVSAQIRKLPAEVTEAFKAKFPDAKNVEWKDNLSNFHADFTLNDASWSAEFSSKGEWKESNKKMTFDALPAAVKDGYNKSKYSDWTPGTITMIEKSDNSVQYKIYTEKSSIVQKRFLYFNKEGQLEKDAPGI